MSQQPAREQDVRSARSASWWSGVLVGVGVAAFVDETVFHQLLHWHHFYDRSTPEAGLVWFAALRRRDDLRTARWVGGLLVGTGAFQLWDGTVQHKLLGLHQIRYRVELWPYDLAWNVAGALGLLIGLILLVRRPRPAAMR